MTAATEQTRGALSEIAERTVIGAYLKETSQPVYSMLFLIPLLVAYELIAVVVNFDRTLQIRNAADIMIKNVLLQFGIRSMLGFMLAVVAIAILCALIALRDSEGSVKPKYFLGMFVESSLYALLLGTFASRFTDIILGVKAITPSPAIQAGLFSEAGLHQWMIALGAGVYEEIVFRVLLISVLLAGFDVLAHLSDQFRLMRPLKFLKGNAAPLLAAFFAAVLFSLFHYIGAHGEIFLWKTFVYRFFAGLILAAIYVFRGLGIAAWSHALYDVLVLMGLS